MEECLKRVPESYYTEKLAASIDGAETEHTCKYGRIDVLTPYEIIEVKRSSNWREGVGQLLDYSLAYPDRKRRLHVLLRGNDEYTKYSKQILPACDKVGIRVTTEIEVDREVPIYRVGDYEFRSLKDLEIKIEHITLQYWRCNGNVQNLTDEYNSLICSVINLAHWTVDKFGGEVVKVRIHPNLWDGNRLVQDYKFEARSSAGNWMYLNIYRYIREVSSKNVIGVAIVPSKNFVIEKPMEYIAKWKNYVDSDEYKAHTLMEELFDQMEAGYR